MSVERRVRSGGILLVDKPGGMTSHDVVAAIRKHVRPLRVGHTGTLDPLADGLLILCVGEATKIAGFIEAHHKLYRAVALLGVETDTQDITGKTVAQTPTEDITEDRIRETARSFVGTIEQTPPAFSAVKVGGVSAHKLARRGKSVRLEPRRVEIRRLDVERVDLPRVWFSVECSKGTYVRTLASDLGKSLGVGGCLESLRRLAVGRFKVADAKPLAELHTKEVIMQAFLPPSEALTHMPALRCSEEQAAQIAHGVALAVGGQMEPPGRESSWAQALGPDGGLLAIGRLVRNGDKVLFQPKRVLINDKER